MFFVKRNCQFLKNLLKYSHPERGIKYRIQREFYSFFYCFILLTVCNVTGVTELVRNVIHLISNLTFTFNCSFKENRRFYICG